ncbi:MAG: lipopolysaccharide biosynthesis protein [Lentimicrobiaceae bacterium]|nr:lipopolysaccharide biosynthesis protein [Lentimicrobiaceae bacterium]
MSKKTIKQQTISGMLWSSIQRFGSMGISFIANLILARILSPEDFGCIGILTVFIAIAGIFVDSGFGAALIQKKNPSQEDYSTIFYLNLTISVILYLILFYCAPAIARFYEIPSLSNLLKVLSIILFLNSFSIIQDNQLRKQLNFRLLSIVYLVSAIIGAVCGIASAYLGYGVWSLVINGLVNAFFRSVLLWGFSKWYPLFVFSKQSMKELFAFGGFIFANSLVYTLRNNIQALIIGKLFLSRDLGFYVQARKLEEIPTNSISGIIQQVTFPVYSKIQDDKEKLKFAQQKSVKSLAYICFPIYVLLIVIANSLFELLFTTKWLESVPYFQILCIGAFAYSLLNVNASIVTASGKSALFFKWNLITSILIFILIGIGSFFGIKGLLYATVLGAWFLYYINVWLASMYTKYTFLEQLKDLFPMLALSIIIGVATWFLGKYLSINYIIVLFIQIIIFVTSYLGLSYFLKIEAFFSFLSIIKDFIKQSK